MNFSFGIKLNRAAYHTRRTDTTFKMFSEVYNLKKGDSKEKIFDAFGKGTSMSFNLVFGTDDGDIGYLAMGNL